MHGLGDAVRQTVFAGELRELLLGASEHGKAVRAALHIIDVDGVAVGQRELGREIAQQQTFVVVETVRTGEAHGEQPLSALVDEQRQQGGAVHPLFLQRQGKQRVLLRVGEALDEERLAFAYDVAQRCAPEMTSDFGAVATGHPPLVHETRTSRARIGFEEHEAHGVKVLMQHGGEAGEQALAIGGVGEGAR